MEELFAHNLRSEDKGLKNKRREIAAAFVVYREMRTEKEKHCEERLYVSWQIAYMGFKASSRKILQETFSNNTSEQIKLKKKIK